MNPLTKEQVEELQEQSIFTHPCVSRSELVELLRGYRRWLAEVEHHENELAKWRKIYDNYMADFGTPDIVSSKQINYHRARLAALQSELKGEG
jgi:hypothetical protein